MQSCLNVNIKFAVFSRLQKIERSGQAGIKKTNFNHNFYQILFSGDEVEAVFISKVSSIITMAFQF